LSRDQGSGGRGQRSEIRKQKTENRRQKAEDRGQRTEDRGQRTEDGDQGRGTRIIEAVAAFAQGGLLAGKRAVNALRHDWRGR
jgi:hypothetical protein